MYLFIHIHIYNYFLETQTDVFRKSEAHSRENVDFLRSEKHGGKARIIHLGENVSYLKSQK